QALLAVVPDHPRALALLAAVRFEQGLREEVLPFAEAALRGNPGEPLALVYRAIVRAAEGNPEALADLRRAEAAAPQRPEPAHFLGSLLFYRGRFAEAAERLDRVPPHEPDAEGRVPLVRLVLASRRPRLGNSPSRRVSELEHRQAVHPQGGVGRIDSECSTADAGWRRDP
ncbi:MAG: hypothetical protein L0323_21605, partial [Planctomycetes bacterium]|nr:hypothetical protein [Planctomycetota bacterium]